VETKHVKRNTETAGVPIS